MFKSKEKKYRDMFYSEAFEAQEELNKLFTFLEKNPDDQETIETIFRITHTLKGNALAIGIEGIGQLNHALEDMFSHIREGQITPDKKFFELLFRTNDKLGEMIDGIKSGKEVSYQGLMAKLELYKESKVDVGSKETEVESNVDEAVEPTVSDLTDPQPGIEGLEKEANPMKEEEAPNISFSDQIQIPVKKLDGLLNLVGELIIEKDTVIARSQERNQNQFKRLHRITSDMQYAIMDIRLVQVGTLFNKFHRIVRDVAEIENKKVDLVLEGTEIEIDRNILKTMSDSLLHLVRNAISHGIEPPETRVGLGKNEVGTVTLRATNEKDSVIIEVIDDGKGLDPTAIRNKAVEKDILASDYASTLSDSEAIQLIFESGFSNAEKVNEISGRGVGMDVVKKSTESVGGQVFIGSNVGQGSSFKLRLPSSMAVKGALLFVQDEQEFAVPLSYTEAVVAINANEIHKVGKGLVANYLGKPIPLMFLKDAFDVQSLKHITEQGRLHKTLNDVDPECEVNVVVCIHNEQRIGICVDKLLQQKEIVEKPLSKPIDGVELFSGATIMGNGNVCLVLNVSALTAACFMARKSMHLGYAEAS